MTAQKCILYKLHYLGGSFKFAKNLLSRLAYLFGYFILDIYWLNFLLMLKFQDFGLAGVRVGVIHTKNPALKKVLASVSYYCSTPSIIQDVAANILMDTSK